MTIPDFFTNYKIESFYLLNDRSLYPEIIKNFFANNGNDIEDDKIKEIMSNEFENIRHLESACLSYYVKHML